VVAAVAAGSELGFFLRGVFATMFMPLRACAAETGAGEC
jgi:hypothetical protein